MEVTEVDSPGRYVEPTLSEPFLASTRAEHDALMSSVIDYSNIQYDMT